MRIGAEAPPSASSPIGPLLEVLLLGIANAVFVDGEQAIALWQTWAVVDLANTRFSPALPQAEARGTCVRNDVSSDRFLRIWVEHGTWPTIHLCNDLVGDYDGNTKLIRKPL